MKDEEIIRLIEEMFQITFLDYCEDKQKSADKIFQEYRETGIIYGPNLIKKHMPLFAYEGGDDDNQKLTKVLFPSMDYVFWRSSKLMFDEFSLTFNSHLLERHQYLGYSIVILLFTYIDNYLNSIAFEYHQLNNDYCDKTKINIGKGDKDRIVSLKQYLFEEDNIKVSLDDKLTKWVEIITEKSFDKNHSKLWENYKKYKTYRDSLVHYRSTDGCFDRNDELMVVEMISWTKELIQYVSILQSKKYPSYLDDVYAIELHKKALIYEREEKNYDLAIQTLNQALYLNPYLEVVRYHLGYSYQLQGDIKNAIRNYNFILLTNPTQEDAQKRISEISIVQKNN